MKDNLHEHLHQLSKLALQMNSTVLQQVEMSFACLFAQKGEEDIQMVFSGDQCVDQLEVVIDELCFSILALHQPLAVDLRYVITVQKTVTDMERMGDEAVSFAKRALYLLSHGTVPHSQNFLLMSQHALGMCRNAIQAITNRDVLLARQVIHDEMQVNGYFDLLHNEFIEYMLADKRNVQNGEHLIRAARCVERIADHACNVAESVIYLVEGRNVKHIKPHLV